MIKILKLILFIVFFIYQTFAFSKTTDKINFNPKYVSEYLSAIISDNNHNSDDSVKYFNSSKNLINIHEEYLKKYVTTLVVNGEVQKSINLLKNNRNKDSSKFFEANLLLLIDNFKKKKFYKNIELLNEFKRYSNDGNYEYIIYEVLKGYNDLFLSKKPSLINNKFGNLSLINQAFQYCYLNQSETSSAFINIINSTEGDYSRYLFFYFNHLIENKDFESTKQISKTINILDSSLLIQQSKKWLDESDYNKFSQIFSCYSEEDIIAEFFYLIANFLSADGNFKKLSFYSNISNYLNPKFYFNLTHLISNYTENKNYQKTKKLLKNFNKDDEIYYWYKLKKLAQIINDEKSPKESLLYVEKKFNEYSNPSIKITYDMANIYKINKEFEKSIQYYSLLLEKINENSDEYADILYRRGSSYERLGEYKSSDEDLLKSLSIKPNNPYVLNYLGYGWLERGYKIQDAISMLDKAYSQKKNDPFIIDSVGWGYYLIGDYKNAEIFLRDVLWKLNRKIQAKYYWESVIESKESDKNMKKKVSQKLIKGLNES